MASSGQVGRMRAAAESRMTDTCRVRASGGDQVWDETAQAYVSVPAVYSYEGPCELKMGGTAPRGVDAVGQILVEQQSVLKLPVATSAGVLIGQVAEVISSATDAALVGKVFRIAGPFAQTYASSRRFSVEEVL